MLPPPPFVRRSIHRQNLMQPESLITSLPLLSPSATVAKPCRRNQPVTGDTKATLPGASDVHKPLFKKTTSAKKTWFRILGLVDKPKSDELAAALVDTQTPGGAAKGFSFVKT